MNFSSICDISIINSYSKEKEAFIKLFSDGILEDNKRWDEIIYSNTIENIDKNINTPVKKRMSQMSCGIFYVMEEGAGKNLLTDEEIYLFTSFGEIDTTDKIIKSITIDKMSLVSPTHFHNSVHNTPLGYYTIIKKLHNYCGTISDGVLTGISFINFIKNRVKLDGTFVVTSGEEYSPFLDMDTVEPKKIKPSFISYRIIPNQDKGFRYLGSFKNLDEIKSINEYKNAKYILTDKILFDEMYKSKSDKIILSEYPIVLDNPCGVIFRLALPFYLSFNENSLVLERNGINIEVFEVKN
ncbi:MAG TPA: beta-ketoacyl synthase chain length factor [Spirochaetota bacterium]|nr:beta-ketoacyl synthase chain length factor [Spirochaetota bacterium]